MLKNQKKKKKTTEQLVDSYYERFVILEMKGSQKRACRMAVCPG